MRLTDAQIRATVATMRMSDGERETLAGQAMGGDPGARLVVWQAFKRNTQGEFSRRRDAMQGR